MKSDTLLKYKIPESFCVKIISYLDECCETNNIIPEKLANLNTPYNSIGLWELAWMICICKKNYTLSSINWEDEGLRFHVRQCHGKLLKIIEDEIQNQLIKMNICSIPSDEQMEEALKLAGIFRKDLVIDYLGKAIQEYWVFNEQGRIIFEQHFNKQEAVVFSKKNEKKESDKKIKNRSIDHPQFYEYLKAYQHLGYANYIKAHIEGNGYVFQNEKDYSSNLNGPLEKKRVDNISLHVKDVAMIISTRYKEEHDQTVIVYRLPSNNPTSPRPIFKIPIRTMQEYFKKINKERRESSVN